MEIIEDGIPIKYIKNVSGEGIDIEGVTAKNDAATENPLLNGAEYEALGALTTDGGTAGDKVPAKASAKGVPYVTIVDSGGAAEASVEAANTARTTGTVVQAIQHVGATGHPMPSGDASARPIYVDVINDPETITGVNDGRKEVANAGTREVLAASTTIKEVTITAETNNTDLIVVGGTAVVAAIATRRGTPLYPGDTVTFKGDDLADFWVDVLVNTEGVTYTYLS